MSARRCWAGSCSATVPARAGRRPCGSESAGARVDSSSSPERPGTPAEPRAVRRTTSHRRWGRVVFLFFFFFLDFLFVLWVGIAATSSECTPRAARTSARPRRERAAADALAMVLSRRPARTRAHPCAAGLHRSSDSCQRLTTSVAAPRPSRSRLPRWVRSRRASCQCERRLAQRRVIPTAAVVRPHSVRRSSHSAYESPADASAHTARRIHSGCTS